jgi:MFS family permease
VTSASLIAVILLGPVYPRVMARLGLRRSVVTGVCAGALILMVMPVWPGVSSWLVLRSLTGFALGLSWIASEVWLNSVSGADARGAVMGLYGTVFSLGTMAGPALLELTGTHGSLPFQIGAVSLLLTLLPLVALPQIQSGPQPFTPAGALAGAVGKAPLVMLAALVAGLVESAELTLLPLFGIHAGFSDRGALNLVAVFLAGNVALQIPIGMLADRYGRRTLLGVCALLSGVGPLLLQPWLATPALLWPLLFVWGGTLYAFYGQGIALLGAAYAPAELTTANTLFVMVYCLGGVIGPSAGGVAMDLWPRNGLQGLLSGAAFLLFAVLVFGSVRRSTRLADAMYNHGGSKLSKKDEAP